MDPTNCYGGVKKRTANNRMNPLPKKPATSIAGSLHPFTRWCTDIAEMNIFHKLLLQEKIVLIDVAAKYKSSYRHFKQIKDYLGLRRAYYTYVRFDIENVDSAYLA